MLKTWRNGLFFGEKGFCIISCYYPKAVFLRLSALSTFQRNPNTLLGRLETRLLEYPGLSLLFGITHETPLNLMLILVQQLKI